MKLKGKIIGSLDSVEQGFRGLYVEAKDKDGNAVKVNGQPVYVLDVEGMEHEDDVRGLKTALEGERKQSGDRQIKISEHEATIARINGELESAKKKPTGKSDDDVKAQVEAATKELTERHKSELEATKAVGETYRSHLDKVMRKNEALKFITTPGKDSKRTAGSADLLLPHVLEQTQWVEDKDATGKITGFRVVVINPQTGAPRIGDAQGNPMTFDGLLDEMFANPTYARAFEPAGGSGSGAQNNTTAPGGKPTVSRRDQQAMNDNFEKIASGEVVVVD
ncbi:MAG TPA: hypothetical protein VLR90_08575 [Blastocatellia bacterium]|nr:hypothetical protein [Blastocatellia bacterium]